MNAMLRAAPFGSPQPPIPSPDHTSKPAAQPLSLESVTKARAALIRRREALWDELAHMAESAVKPVDYMQRVQVLHGELLVVVQRVSDLDAWLAAQPAA